MARIILAMPPFFICFIMPLHLVELGQQAVHFLHRHAGTGGDARLREA